MQTTNNTILITGGGTGIGLAMAEAFLKAGNEVLICGRRESKLNEAKEKFPQLYTKVCDVSKKNDREELYEWVTAQFPQLNMLVNNAGNQKVVQIALSGTSFMALSNGFSLNSPICSIV